MIDGYILNEIVLGDSRLLAETIQDQSVTLILTDPIYSQESDYIWLAQTARRILKPDGALLCWSNGHWHRTNTTWLEKAGMTYRWDFACLHNSGLSPMNGKIISKTNRLIWMDFDKTSKLLGYIPDGFISTPWLRASEIHKATEHRWTKSPKFTRIAIKAFTLPGDLVYDPFAGGGTVPLACVELERNFIASEIDPDTAAFAAGRVAKAHPPIGLEKLEQLIFLDEGTERE
jgi:DNA modification methylase